MLLPLLAFRYLLRKAIDINLHMESGSMLRISEYAHMLDNTHSRLDNKTHPHGAELRIQHPCKPIRIIIRHHRFPHYYGCFVNGTAINVVQQEQKNYAVNTRFNRQTIYG